MFYRNVKINITEMPRSILMPRFSRKREFKKVSYVYIQASRLLTVINCLKCRPLYT